jgi:hypothetical protein
VIGSASMRPTAGGADIVLRAPQKTLDGTEAERFIVSDAPIAASTTFTFTVSGTNNGAAFSKTCQFTTGAGRDGTD